MQKAGGGKSIIFVDMKDNLDIDLGSLVLPKEIFNHFELVDVISNDKQIDLFLDEKTSPPSPTGYSSKGFTEQAVIQDFPLRGKAVYLHIRRRKWLNSHPLRTTLSRKILLSIDQERVFLSRRKEPLMLF